MESYSTCNFLKLWNIGGKGLYIHGISRITHARFSFFINSLNSLLNSWLLHCVLLAVGKFVHYWITCCRPKHDFNNSGHGNWSYKLTERIEHRYLYRHTMIRYIHTLFYRLYLWLRLFCWSLVTIIKWPNAESRGHNLPSSKWFWIKNSLVIDFCQFTNALSFFTMWAITALATPTEPKMRRFSIWFKDVSATYVPAAE